MSEVIYRMKGDDGVIRDYRFSDYEGADELKALISTNVFLTFDEIVNDFYNRMTDVDKIDAGKMERDELIMLHHGTGRHIRNLYGLWVEDNPHIGDVHPDDLSMEIIVGIWERIKGIDNSNVGSEVMTFTDEDS